MEILSYDLDTPSPFPYTYATVVTHDYPYSHIEHVMTQNEIRSILKIMCL